MIPTRDQANKLEDQLWNSPFPATRAEYLARQDIRNELHEMRRKIDWAVNKAGYDKIAGLHFQPGVKQNG